MTEKKSKSFDCVVMKAEAQTDLIAEYGRRESEFPDYGAFLDSKLTESPEMRRLWESLLSRDEKASA